MNVNEVERQLLGDFMKNLILVFLFISFINTTHGRSLGGMESGGGMGVVCYNSSEDIESVELLDLWEARVLYGRSVNLSGANVEEIVRNALSSLKDSIYTDYLRIAFPDDVFLSGPDAFYELLKFETDRLLQYPAPNNVKRLRGVELTLTNDSFEVIKPKECKIRQLIRYIDTAHGGEILINQDYLDHLDDINLAALYVHEAYYAKLREAGERSSIRVRRAIGMVFSGYQFPIWKSFLPQEYYFCSGPVGYGFVYKDGDKGIAFAPGYVDGRYYIGPPPKDSWAVRGDYNHYFNSHTYILSNMGPDTGSDYSYEFKIVPLDDASDPDDQVVKWVPRLKLTSAPDGTGEGSELKCELVKKE